MAVTARGGMILEWSRMNRGVRNTSFSHHDNKLGKKKRELQDLLAPHNQNAVQNCKNT